MERGSRAALRRATSTVLRRADRRNRHGVAESASRADKVLRSWTRDGDGQGEPPPAWPTKADPEIQQEVAQLEHSIDHGDRTIIRAAGGFQAASKRLSFLYQLPDGTPITQNLHGAIDRCSTWSTLRLISPEAAT